MKRAWISLVLLSGCVQIPTSNLVQEFSPKLEIEGSVEHALTTATFHEGEWPSEKWWEMFNDSHLNELIEIAICNNPTMKRATDTFTLAQDIADQKRARLFPELDGGAIVNWAHFSKYGLFRLGGKFTAFPANLYMIDIGLKLHHEFDFWGKNRHTFQAATNMVLASAAEEAMARLIISTGTAYAYFAAAATHASLQILEEVKKEKQELYALAQERYDAALDTQIDYLSAQQEYLAVKREIARLEEKLALDLHTIAALIGKGPSEQIITLGTPSMESSFPLPKSLSAELLVRRPDLMAQLWRVEAAAHSIGAAKADFYPNIDLTALGGIDTIQISKLFTPSSLAGFLIPALRLPIFTAGRIKAQLRAKESEFNTAVDDYHSLVLTSAQEVANGFASLSSRAQQQREQDKIVKAARQNYALSNSRFENGISPYMEVLMMQEKWLDERLRNVQLSFSRFEAAVDLIKALGGGYQ